jgi:predicted ArsR family transcriptional regulator
MEPGNSWSQEFCFSAHMRVAMKAKVPASEGRFAYEGLDRVIHERARLSVLTSLITNPKGLTFGDLKQLCGLTDGNLSRHLQVLEKESMVDIVKGHDHNRPQTMCRITAPGRKRYLEYLSTLEQVVRDAAKVTKDEPAPTLIRGLTPTRA